MNWQTMESAPTVGPQVLAAARFTKAVHYVWPSELTEKASNGESYFKAWARVVHPDEVAPDADTKQIADGVPPLPAIRQAIADYHYALDTRQHGGVAQDKAFNAICEAVGMSWQQGKEAERRADAVSVPFKDVPVGQQFFYRGEWFLRVDSLTIKGVHQPADFYGVTHATIGLDNRTEVRMNASSVTETSGRSSRGVA